MFCQPPCPVRLFKVFLNNREFIAAETDDDVVAAQALRHPLARLSQQIVACRVTKSVIHILEMIEIKAQHRHGRILAIDIANGMYKPFIKEGAIWQSGQGIVTGQKRGVVYCLLQQAQRERPQRKEDEQ